jgi:hypothetical protein
MVTCGCVHTVHTELAGLRETYRLHEETQAKVLRETWGQTKLNHRSGGDSLQSPLLLIYYELFRSGNLGLTSHACP